MIARSYTTETISFRPRPFPDRSERGSIYLTWADNPENRVDETSTSDDNNTEPFTSRLRSFDNSSIGFLNTEGDIIIGSTNNLSNGARLYTENLAHSKSFISKNADLIEKLKGGSHFCNNLDDDEMCVLCQEKFSDKKFKDFGLKIIKCSSCNQSFCMGEQKDIINDCKGLLYYCRDKTTCPCCRSEIKNWDLNIHKKIDPQRLYNYDQSMCCPSTR